MPTENYQELPIWEILDTYFNNSGGSDSANILVKHQIDSYNEFLDKKLVQIIQGFNPIQIFHNYNEEIGDFMYKISINILQPSITKPMYQTQDGSQILMTPNLARMNNLTYATNLYVHVHVVTDIINKDGITERNENTVPSVCIGRIPMMVRSKGCVLTQMPNLAEGSGKQECRYDPGGYFIINGNEKVVICQDRISENKTLVFAPTTNSDGLSAEIRSMPDGVFLPPKTTSLHLSAKPNHLGHIIRMSTTFLRTDIPVFTMFRALGIETDRDIISYIVHDIDNPKNQRIIAELLACCEDSSEIHTQADAHQVLLRMVGTTGTPREYLEKPEVACEILNNMITNDFLPHVGPCFRRKALYLGYMMNKLLSIFLGYQDYDNRDSYLYKRIDTTGVLMSNLFRQCYSKMVKEMRNLVTRELNLWRASSDTHTNLITSTNVHKFFKPTLLETGLRYALSTGNWGVKTIGTFQNIRQGVAQVLNRMSYLSTMSHLRRINTPMEKSGKLVQPRKLENSQFGMICPAETPEGSAVGLVKNMAMSTQITISMSSSYIRSCMVDMGVCVMTDDISHKEAMAFVKRMGSDNVAHVSINGDLVGYHPDPNKFYHAIKSLKRQGVIAPTTAIVWDIKQGCIFISTEAGRMCRPMFIVDEVNTPIAAPPAPKKARGKKTEAVAEVFETRRQLRLPPERGAEWDAKYGFKSFIEYVAPLHSGKEAEGFIELMDTEELDKAMVAMHPRDLERSIKGSALPPCYTHCEIHPSLMNGILAVNIPFSDHNQSPRNCYQCLWEESAVLMAEGGWKRIKDVKEGDYVISFHPQTMAPSITRVLHQYKRPNMKSMVTVVTCSGRSIIATRDHKFMTNKGWVEAGSLVVDTDHAMVGIQVGVPNITTWGALMSAEQQAEWDTAPLDTLEENTKQVLKELGMYPLSLKHPKMAVLCRMVGWTHEKGVFQHKLDKDMYDDDARYLGFIQHGGADMVLKTLLETMASSVEDWAGKVSVLAGRELIAGYIGARKQEADVLELDSWVSTAMPNMASMKNKPGYSLSHLYGCRYNTMRLLKHARMDEYLLYKDYVSMIDKEAQLMTEQEWMSAVHGVGNTLFVPVLSCKSSRNCMIADITVESENHSFIGGDCFTVSNSAMGKQAVGVYMSNFNHRMDTMAHVLNYPQRPLVHTRLSKYTHSDTLPAGINAVVAIMTYTGFNMEDSVMINQSALDRGLFTSTYYKSYRDQCNKNHSTGEEEVFTRPDPMTTAHMKPCNYEKLGADGFVPKNTEIDSNDILVGKVMPHKVHGVIYPRDTSMGMKANDEGFVDMNYTGTNGEGYKFCKVRLRKYRKPMVGDKVACTTPGHEVLTRNGFKPIELVTLEDEVAVLKDGKYLVYEKPEAVHHYLDFEGEMYHISNQGVDLDVTLNHRMWVSKRGYVKVDGKTKDDWKPYDFSFAKDIIGKRVRYKKDGEWDMPDYQYIMPKYIDNNDSSYVRPTKEVDMEAWLTFFGIWMAEGCAGYSYGVSIAANKNRVKKALAEIVPRLGYHNKVRNEKLNIRDRQLREIFIPLSVGATNKSLPDWVWLLSKKQCDILLHGMLLGDGNWTKTGIHYSTSSVKLRDDVYRLAIHAGYATDVYQRNLPDTPPMKKDGTYIIPTTDAWIVHIRKNRTAPTVNHGHTHEQEIQQEYTYRYKGPVYCLTVSSGVFMVRKNFKHVWSGNSRHAQKGSIGMVYPQEDMPFTKDGIIPDVILNPHAIPSRMTIAQLMECIMGKACSFMGTFGDATPFNECTVEDIATMLEKFGMERYGNEIMYHGRTGNQIKTEVFIGPTFYQRLKHMVTDKMFSRGSNGPVVLLTRQPAEGRARNGGLRFGKRLPRKVRAKTRASPTQRGNTV